MPLREIKVGFSDSDYNAIDQIAKANKIARAEVIRRAMQNNVKNTALTVENYHRIVSTIHKNMNGVISRLQAERAAAIAINAIAAANSPAV
jgi:metal-responsive CopG/Arc/MetJ family transcriptional regulator